jgi:arabinogalactan endo-1,4-beta-galactosidase
LLNALSEHTHDVLTTLKRNGVTPEWVQVGNEIRGGMLWPEGSTDNFDQLTQLLNQGYKVVKAVDPSIKVIVHLDRGNDKALFAWFFGNITKRGAKYDVIGMSYYPHWLGSDYTKTIEDLGQNLQDMATTYKKEVMIVEVGGHYQKAQNTFDLLTAVISKVKAVPNGKGLGVIYWEPQSRKSFHKGYSLGCWNDDGTPNMALRAFK